MKTLIISPHPDDEVLGCGGTIRRLVKQGGHVVVAIVTKGTPLYPAAQVRTVRAEARKAAKRLGVAELLFMNLPVTTLHLMPEHKINRVFDRLINRQVMPDTIFLPFPGDRHEDHRQVFEAAMVALRCDGRRRAVQRVYCYETVSETHWAAPGLEPAFEPTTYADISDTLSDKLAAMQCYRSQLAAGIPARSIEAIEALARFRGSVVGLPAAEAFHLVRELWIKASKEPIALGKRK
ncbi:MAG: PIG-L family deacetylase [Phycisphaerales bacterium]|nr:PIG-L family deacetylase [Phycisphaerales bacterium]